MDKNSEEVVEQQIQEFSELLQKTKQVLWDGEYATPAQGGPRIVTINQAFVFAAQNKDQLNCYSEAVRMLKDFDDSAEKQAIGPQERQKQRHMFLDSWIANVVAVLPQVRTAPVQEDEDNTMPIDVVAEEPEEKPWCVMCGNPVGGFDVYGPFDSNDAAVEWADGLIDKDWWIMRLQKPGPV